MHMLPMNETDRFSFKVEFQVENIGHTRYPDGCKIVRAYEGDVPGSGGWPNIEVVAGEMTLEDWARFWKSWFGARMDWPKERTLDEVKDCLFESLNVLEINGQVVGMPTPPYDPRDGIPAPTV